MLRRLSKRTQIVLVLAFLGTPCLAQEVQVGFGIQGAALRSFYDPGIEVLEREVRDRLLAHCKDDPYLSYWSLVPAAEDSTARGARPLLDIALLLQDDVLRVQLDVQSAFLGGLPDTATRLSARLAPPAELLLITTRGAPPPKRLAELVEGAFQDLMANNLATVSDIMSQGCPLGRFEHVFPPQVSADGRLFVTVLPIDVSEERNCFLGNSEFELKCESSRSTDTRLDSHGTGHGADYPPLESVPPEERIPGVTVEIEQLRIGGGPAEPLGMETHADLMRSVRPHYFFLRKLNKGAHMCISREISVVP